MKEVRGINFDEEQNEYLKRKARETERSVSGYLRLLVNKDMGASEE